MDGRALTKLGWAIGDPSRASMLSALMGGQALTAGELAAEAGVAGSTASSHLTALLQADLVTVLRQGRHRYYRLAAPSVAEMLEQISSFTSRGSGYWRRHGPAEPHLRFARTCYDHLAGELGVRIFDAMSRSEQLVVADADVALSLSGKDLLRELGASQPLGACRLCLDWSERRHHLGGAPAAALLTLFLKRRWLVRGTTKRALRLTESGRRAFDLHFAAPTGAAPSTLAR